MLHACAARFITVVFREKFLELNNPILFYLVLRRLHHAMEFNE
jgi:hypothetical protein